MSSLSYSPSSSSSSLHTLTKSPFSLPPFSLPISSPLPTINLNSNTLSPPLHCSTTTTTTTSTAAATSTTIKARLKNGETLYGIFLLSFSPTISEIAALSGYDFAVIDMEHGPGGVSDSLNCLRALASAHTPCILRLPESTPVWAKKALDLGPQGIMFPMIDSAKEARKAVSYCLFPPKGVRGSAHTVVRGSDYGIDEGYLRNYEEELLIMCQVESVDGVEKIGEIAGVEGVDCVQMGPLGLSASIGFLWDPGNKKVKEMMRKAENGVLGSIRDGEGGAFLSGFAMPNDGPESLRLRGYHMVSGAVDVGLFRSAAVEDVRKFKMSLAQGDHEGKEGKDGDEKYWSE